MNGAECLLRTLLAHGVDTCFMNPGTSEMQFVAALDRVPGMRGVLCLFEGVCSGAADGYARMLRRPAATLLHLGPGLANGLSNFHNARKARSPVVSIVGQHTTGHLRCDAPLAADIEAFARPVSEYVRTLEQAQDMGEAAAATIHAACAPPGQVATLIVPADFSWSDGGEPGRPLGSAAAGPGAECVREAARILRSGEPAGLLLGGGALLEPGRAAAGRLAGGTGVRVFANRYAARMACGGGRFTPQRLAYFPEVAEPMLAGLKHLILVESQPPVSFFGYPGRRSFLAPEDCAFHVLAPIEANGTEALEALVEACGVGRIEPPVSQISRPALPEGASLTADTIGRALASLLPEGAILSDEMVSSGEAILRHLSSAASYDLLPVTGGAIGQGLPVALGAALACPDRKVIALEADGSGMYTLQSLWTMVRERLDVVTVILANRRYRILDIEMQRTGAGEMGPMADDMVDISRPDLDWVRLSEGMGVPATRATTADEFVTQFRAVVSRAGPTLIEAVLE
ncbi:MAG: acetolactate synthase large subunit [Bryobacteraceae bacterium]|jgi:acetolactate synthase-1/2/3 large subunit